ncbi:MAG TPA: 50S ribosomal protein L4 [Candidatus Paceibacterota bacterium]
MNAPVYNQEGTETGKIDLPENIFGVRWNADLVHQVVEAMRSNFRVAIAHAKGRGEVRGGGIKPWKQKGTGRARHGSIRSPIWVGGGVAHGPNKNKDFDRKINKKVRAKALATVLSRKLKDKEVYFLDALTTDGKTKNAVSVLGKLADKFGKKEFMYKKGSRLLIALPGRDVKVEKSFNNIKVVKVLEQQNMNALETLTYKTVIFVDYKHAK